MSTSIRHQDDIRLPIAWELWRHYKGGEYAIVGLAIDTATNNVTVVYTEAQLFGNVDNMAILYTRDLSNFLGSTDDHIQRFTYFGKAPE